VEVQNKAAEQNEVVAPLLQNIKLVALSFFEK